MCQIHTGTYVALLAPEKNDYAACHPAKTTTYILHVVPITTHTHVRLKTIGNKGRKEEKRRKKRKQGEGRTFFSNILVSTNCCAQPQATAAVTRTRA